MKTGDIVVFIKEYHKNPMYSYDAKQYGWPKYAHVYKISSITNWGHLNLSNNQFQNWEKKDVIKATKVVARFWGKTL